MKSEWTAMYLALDLVHAVDDAHPEPYDEMMLRICGENRTKIRCLTEQRARFHVCLYIAGTIDDLRDSGKATGKKGDSKTRTRR